MDANEVAPAPEPDVEPSDPHEGPLDNDEDGRFLRRDDRRRLDAERRRGRPFSEEDEERDEGGFGHRVRRFFHRDEEA